MCTQTTNSRRILQPDIPRLRQIPDLRVWCHPRPLRFPNAPEGAEAPLARIRQLEYIAEDSLCEYRH